MKIAWDDAHSTADTMHAGGATKSEHSNNWKDAKTEDAVTNARAVRTHRRLLGYINITVDSLGPGVLIPIDCVTTGSGEWLYATAVKASRSIC